MVESGEMKVTAPLKVAWAALNVFWVLGFVALGLALILTGVMWTMDIGAKYNHLPVEIRFALDEDGEVANGIHAPGSLPIIAVSDIQVESRHVPGLKYVMAMPVLLLLGFLWIVYQLRTFLRTVRRGTPFDPDNGRRLRMIGTAIALGGPVFGFLNFIYGQLFAYLIDVPNASVTVPLDIYPFVVFLGLVVIGLGQVFDYGARLQAEQSLTV